MYSDLLLLLPALLGFIALLLLRKRADPKPQPELQPKIPDNAIVVDGSNVMHWGTEPSSIVLANVLRALEDKGLRPIVFFDANAGYVLGDRYYNENKLADLLGMPAKYICVVNKGVVADEVILDFATDFDLRIVTNDQFRDWRVKFPIAARKGQLLHGNWRDGSVMWRGQL